MEPIDDFELFSMLFDADEIRHRDVIPFAENPPHPRLRDTGFHWFGEEWGDLTLCYKGCRVEGMGLFGGSLRFQFRTRHGFIVMLSRPSGSDSGFSISIYYILDDFRGGEWGMFSGREKERPLEWAKRVILKRWPKTDVFAPKGPEPLQDFRIMDESNLAFRVHRHGWYRMTLFEQRPRRFLVPNWRYEAMNSYFRHRRYFNVRKIYNPGCGSEHFDRRLA